MIVDKRLNTIASLVTKDAILVDIGSDHGYLCIKLSLENKIKYGYSCDVNQGPLDNAKKNILKYEVNNIETILSNGLDKLQDIEFSDVVIAGMGGALIVDILNDNIHLLKNKTLILQPNINAKKVRSFLVENNFTIIEEKIIEENDILYEIIKAKYQKSDELDQLQLELGPINMIELSNELILLIEEKIKKINYIIGNMPKNNVKYELFQQEKEMLERYLNEIRKTN